MLAWLIPFAAGISWWLGRAIGATIRTDSPTYARPVAPATVSRHIAADDGVARRLALAADIIYAIDNDPLVFVSDDTKLMIRQWYELRETKPSSEELLQATDVLMRHINSQEKILGSLNDHAGSVLSWVTTESRREDW